MIELRPSGLVVTGRRLVSGSPRLPCLTGIDEIEPSEIRRSARGRLDGN